VSNPTRFLDRESGRLCEEPVYGRGALDFAYGTRLGRALLAALPHHAVSDLYGRLQRRPSTRARIPGFIAQLGIDAAEAEYPVAHYRSLDEFFCRRLKPGARPVDPDPRRFVMPADGRTLVIPRINQPHFTIKGSDVHLADLVRDPAEADRYRGGSAVIVRLAPCDYHRFHFPAAGSASVARRVGGRLHSVHPIALESGAPAFRNQRDLTALDTDAFGRVTLVEVGAFAVGTIVQTYRPGPVIRGQEKGYFRFGGSTVVALVPPDRLVLDDDLVRASAEGLETFVKMGVGIGSGGG
jgi:phosphatidylserine decarboxylase